jgi:branched-chain amino acid transport system ATP-binding protein
MKKKDREIIEYSDKEYLKIVNLNVFYGNIHAIKDVSFNVEKGSITTLLGANGAGKTSVIKTISGLNKKISGAIYFEGENIIKEHPEKIVKRGIIHCPEGRRIFRDLTVKENLSAGGYSVRDHKEFNENLEFVYSCFPILKERERQQASTLSGGELQMLAIGRSLMASPKLLMLDEPSLGLAPLIIEQIFEIIKHINQKGVTILIVEQNARQSLEISDFGYLFEVGKMVLGDTSEKLLKDNKLISTYLGGSNDE